MDHITRTTFTFTDPKNFSNEFKYQWEMYNLVYKSPHQAFLYDLTLDACLTIKKHLKQDNDTKIKEHFIDLKFPDFSFSFTVNFKY